MLDNTGDQSDVMSPLIELGSLLANITTFVICDCDCDIRSAFIALTVDTVSKYYISINTKVSTQDV